MNILLMSYDYPPYTGGIANVSHKTALQLSKMGERIIVVSGKTRGAEEFDRTNDFLTYRCSNIFFLRELALIFLLPYFVLKHKINVIYILVWCQGGFAAYLTSKLLKTPYILHAQGSEFLDYKKTFLDKIKYGLFRRQYKKWVLNGAKKIIAISNYTKNIVIKEGAMESRVCIIHWAVDMDRFKPGLDIGSVISRYNLTGKKVLLTVSRLVRYKGHDTVINLLPQILKKIPNTVYMIVGSGSDRVYLEALVKKLNLEKDVIFTGHADDSILPLYYNACDVFIMLTRESPETADFEGYGLVYLEANSCSRPVIGAMTGGIPDVIKNNMTGYLIEPDDTQEIINKITLLLENKELAKKLGEEGRRRIAEDGLTWEAAGEKIRSILRAYL